MYIRLKQQCFFLHTLMGSNKDLQAIYDLHIYNLAFGCNYRIDYYKII